MELFGMDIRTLTTSHKKWREKHKEHYTKTIITTDCGMQCKAVHCLECNQLLILDFKETNGK